LNLEIIFFFKFIYYSIDLYDLSYPGKANYQKAVYSVFFTIYLFGKAPGLYVRT